MMSTVCFIGWFLLDVVTGGIGETTHSEEHSFNHTHKCRQNYLRNLSSIVGFDVDDYFHSQIVRDVLVKSSGQHFVNLGDASMGYLIDLTMVQLNMTGSYDTICPKNVYISDTYLIDSYNKPVYLSNFLFMRNYQAYVFNENYKFLIHKVNETQWLQNKLSKKECAKRAGPHISCYIPLPFIPYNPSTRFQLAAHVSKENAMNSTTSVVSLVSASFEAYYSFLHCLIPADRLYWIETTTAPLSSLSGPIVDRLYELLKSQNYWKRVTDFLELPVSSTTMNGLVSAGIPSVNESQLYCNSRKCTFHTPRRNELAPLMPPPFPGTCAIDQPNIDVVKITHPRMLHCAKEYATDLSNILGKEYESLIYMKMTHSIVAKTYRHNKKTQLYLNIGPGSTGTKSLFYAMVMLNITSRHYFQVSTNCQYIPIKFISKDFGNNIEPLADDRIERIWWGDLPVPEDWWFIYAQYPEQTRFTMTYVDYDKWYASRLKTHHCNKRKDKATNGCNAPMPFSLYKHLNLQLKHNKTLYSLHNKLLNATYLTHMNSSTSKSVFKAYHKLARCAIPERDMLWLDMSKQRDSSGFWRELTAFMNMTVSPAVYDRIVSEGVPYVSDTKGCFVGKNNCTIGEILGLENVIAPSVCTTEKKKPIICENWKCIVDQ